MNARRMKFSVHLFLMVAMVLIALAALAPLVATAQTQDIRYCGLPKRDASGAIARDLSVRAAFVRLHPCPSTGKTTGACPGWQVDHVIPLASCGCDSVSNMQWLPVEIKTAPGDLAKDRWERRHYKCQPTAESAEK